jgi:isopentenyl-diphosphate delta-isomerase
MTRHTVVGMSPNACPQVELTTTAGASLGSMDKLQAHQGEGHLHRAFSVFLFDGDRVLLQRRAMTKYHFAGLWTNSCCGHPAPDSDVRGQAVRRTKQELGVDVQLVIRGDFLYRALDPTSGLVEHELDTVLVGDLPATDLDPDPAEVSATRLTSLTALRQQLSQLPETFTPWLGQALDLVSPP